MGYVLTMGFKQAWWLTLKTNAFQKDVAGPCFPLWLLFSEAKRDPLEAWQRKSSTDLEPSGCYTFSEVTINLEHVTNELPCHSWALSYIWGERMVRNWRRESESSVKDPSMDKCTDPWRSPILTNPRACGCQVPALQVGWKRAQSDAA